MLVPVAIKLDEDDLEDFCIMVVHLFAGVCKAVLEEAADVPVLGVCLGMQALAHVHGAKVQRAAEPVHGRLSHISHNGHPLFRDIPSGSGQTQSLSFRLTCALLFMSRSRNG